MSSVTHHQNIEIHRENQDQTNKYEALMESPLHTARTEDLRASRQCRRMFSRKCGKCACRSGFSFSRTRVTRPKSIVCDTRSRHFDGYPGIPQKMNNRLPTWSKHFVSCDQSVKTWYQPVMSTTSGAHVRKLKSQVSAGGLIVSHLYYSYGKLSI
jgi:hypothetical protein